MLTTMLFVKHLRVMQDFYAQGFELTPTEDSSASDEFVVLLGDETRLALHQVPSEIAERLDVDPLHPRTDNPVKLLFGVPDPIALRGRLHDLGARFTDDSNGTTFDAVDPEGNVFRVSP